MPRLVPPVVHADLATSPWPHFAPIAIDAGLRAVHAFPMRLRARVLGTLNLFMAHTGVLSEVDAAAAQALAHAATITLIHHRDAHRSHEVTAQLQTALNSRVAVEQAKGAWPSGPASVVPARLVQVRAVRPGDNGAPWRSPTN